MGHGGAAAPGHQCCHGGQNEKQRCDERQGQVAGESPLGEYQAAAANASAAANMTCGPKVSGRGWESGPTS
jgi:hypothetical protein